MESYYYSSNADERYYHEFKVKVVLYIDLSIGIISLKIGFVKVFLSPLLLTL